MVDNRIITIGSFSFNKALLDNNAYFTDIVWAIDMKEKLIYVFVDKINPNMTGAVMNFLQMEEHIRASHNSKDVNFILKEMSYEALSKLQQSEEHVSGVFEMNGKPHALRTVKTPEFDDDGQTIKAVYVTFQDIIHQKQTEDALEVARQELHRYLSAVQCGILQYTRDSKDLLYANDIALSILGYDSFEDLKKNFNGVAATVLAEDAENMAQLLDSLKNDGDKVTYEYHVHHRNGKNIVCLGSAQLICRTGKEPIMQRSMIDITDSYTKELQRAHSEVTKSMRISYTLLEDYKNVYVVNMKTGTMEARRQSGNYHVETDTYNVLPEPYTPTINYYIKHAVFPDDREGMTKFFALENVIKGLQYNNLLEYNYRSISKGLHHFQAIIRSLDNDHFIAAVRNVDKAVEKEVEMREELQLALQQSDEFLKLTAEITQLGMWYFTLDENGNRESDIQWSTSAPAMLGLKDKSQLPRTEVEWAAMIHPEDRGFVMGSYSEVFKGNGGLGIQFRVLMGDGTYHWFTSRDIVTRYDENGVPRLFFGTFRDIQKEIDLEEKEKLRVRQIEETSIVNLALAKDYSHVYIVNPDETLTVRKQEGYVVSNKEGSSHNIIPYKNTWEQYIKSLVHPEDKEKLSADVQFDAVMKRMEESDEFSFRYRKVNESGEINYMQGRFIRLEDGRLILSVRNIDSVVRHEAEQRKIIEDALTVAEHANKAKTRFLNSMSHDIRTPMNAVIGYTALAFTHLGERDKIMDYLKKIQVSSKHLLSLINDVLDMSRIESGKVVIEEKENSLSEILHDLKNIIQADIKKKHLSLFLDTMDVIDERVWCDKLRLNQILLNIISNSIKFTPANGSVSLNIIQVPCEKPGCATYEFHIKDTGIGMSKEFVKDIFVPFSRERTSTVSGIQGTGLGMAIVKNIVDMMDGKIAVDSVQGMGTHFKVTLTFRKADNIEKRNWYIPELSSSHALVVDDNFDTCESVCRMLSELGMRPEWTMNGHDAVLRATYAKNIRDPFGVYIVDLVIPDMNGIEVIRRIRKEVGDENPIIILTSYDLSEYEDEAKDAGVTACLSKPIFMSEFVALLENSVKTEEVAEAVESRIDNKNIKTLNGIKILLVEDNEMNREIAEMLLGENGAQIESVNDGIEAVERMKNVAPGTYDLIFMDVQMPIMNGYDATRNIRSMENPAIANIPIIALSANALKEDRELSAAAGMNAHISKPFEVEEVIDAVNNILGHR